MLDQIRRHAQERTFLDFEARGEDDSPPELLFAAWPRPASAEDVRQLEAQGCVAEDWARVRLAPAADRACIRRVRFGGLCLVGAVGGDPIVLDDGLTVDAGIENAVLRDCLVGDGAVIRRCAHVERADIQRGAVLLDCGIVAGGATGAMGLDREISFGAETGGRALTVFPGVTSAELAWLAANGESPLVPEDYRAICAAVQGRVARCTVLVGEGARLVGAGCVRRSAIGPAACVHGTASIEDSIVLSSAARPSRVGAGASLARVSTNEGVTISGGARCRDAHFCQASTATDGVLVESALVGENTHLAAGECRHAFVGPFVGMHHQALLIATIWPEGRGNVGYGANVGSNHSGKAADLEHKAGEGLFFGLGSIVKFPCDTTRAPYTLVAAGVHLLPQRLAFPFSLIAPPSSRATGLSPAVNELFPGWMLGRCLYGLLRAQAKFAGRDRSGAGLETRVLRAEWAPLVVDAIHRLENAAQPAGELESGEAFHLGSSLPGCGKNYVTESARNDALAWYTDGLHLIAAFSAAEALEAGAEVEPALGDLLLSRIAARPTSAADWGRWAGGRIRRAVESARSDIQRDVLRGDKVLGDFSSHRSPGTDAFLAALEARAEALSTP